jgi:hypothetical protein
MDLGNEELVIKITKAKYNGEFSHWEVDVESNSANIYLGGTAPTIWGVLDMASEYIWEQGQEDGWFKDNANSRSNLR